MFNLNFINTIFNWVNLISFIRLSEGIFIIYGKYTPILVKGKLEGGKLQSWRNIRFIGCVILSVGFYAFTFSKNLHLEVNVELSINIIGLILIFTGETINIVNNIRKIGKWSSTV